MTRRFYPAVLEKSGKVMFAAWFPDFPDCVTAGLSQDEAIQKAEVALALAMDVLTEQEKNYPEPTAIKNILLPKGCRFAARCPFTETACLAEPPRFAEVSSGHWSRCIRAPLERLVS